MLRSLVGSEMCIRDRSMATAGVLHNGDGVPGLVFSRDPAEIAPGNARRVNRLTRRHAQIPSERRRTRPPTSEDKPLWKVLGSNKFDSPGGTECVMDTLRKYSLSPSPSSPSPSPKSTSSQEASAATWLFEPRTTRVAAPESRNRFAPWNSRLELLPGIANDWSSSGTASRQSTPGSGSGFPHRRRRRQNGEDRLHNLSCSPALSERQCPDSGDMLVIGTGCPPTPRSPCASRAKKSKRGLFDQPPEARWQDYERIISDIVHGSPMWSPPWIAA
eukprot:TRINITY_DN312_c0_g1_i24.p1 TRINITY_DN312_c0_g1~~TRINITY_DN312_c0_g1_i24.p1  ORF type:complete len:289 (+),score=44.05 TRINITY_DN312_c0_g1_i24:46-867(+)